MGHESIAARCSMFTINYVSTQSTVRSRLYAREKKLDQDADLLTITVRHAG